jgi:hypothetical protein
MQQELGQASCKCANRRMREGGDTLCSLHFSFRWRVGQSTIHFFHFFAPYSDNLLLNLPEGSIWGTELWFTAVSCSLLIFTQRNCAITPSVSVATVIKIHGRPRVNPSFRSSDLKVKLGETEQNLWDGYKCSLGLRQRTPSLSQASAFDSGNFLPAS